MTRARRLHVGFILSLSVAIAVGCNKTETTAPPGNQPPNPGSPSIVPETGEHAAGKRVFNSNCVRCHTIGAAATAAPMPGKKMQGPDLATVARDPAHTPEWFGDYIRDPQSKKSDARMPKFQGKISDDDFKALVEYLASLK